MLIFVPLTQIDDNPFQRRTEYGDIEELAADILRHQVERPDTFGLQQVPGGRVVADDGDLVPTANLDPEEWLDGQQLRPGWRVQLEFGHRRKRAFAWLVGNGHPKYHQLPVYIRDLDDDQMLNGVWSENRARRDLSAVEEAELIKLKLAQLGENGSHAAIGEEWGLSRPVISNRLRLLELPEAVQQANREGKLSERQALALAPIVRIGELTKGSGIEWGSKVGTQWGSPASPEKYLEHVLANPDTATSDNVREYTHRLTSYAGERLPGWLAKVKFDDVSGIEQPQCKGCPFRIDQSCLKPSCMKRKLTAWPDMALAIFSEKTDIPISDRAADFEPFADDMKLRQRLKDLYKAGETGGGMVCGWLVKDGAARPYKNDSDYVYNIANEDDGRFGIALGYRGNPPAADPDSNEPAAPIYELPEYEQIEAWHGEVRKITRAARREMLEAVTDALMYQVNEFDVIQALMSDPDEEWIDEAGKIAKDLAEFLVEKGRGVGWAYNPYTTVQLFQKAASRAGLGSVLGDESETAVKTAVLILDRWYENHLSSWRWENTAREIWPWIEQWEQLPGADTSPMAEHVARTKKHIEEKLVAEGGAEKERRAERDRILQDPDADIDKVSDAADDLMEEVIADLTADGLLPNDTAVCAECSDILEPADAITCSCGAVLCEDCYVEENHVFHDKNRDPVFDDLVAQFPELVEAETAESEDGYSFTDEMETFVQSVETAVSEPAEELTMTEVATEWLRTYRDKDGRTWQDLTPSQTHHANSPCYQAFVAAFPEEKEPKFMLKQALARLKRETAVSQETP